MQNIQIEFPVSFKGGLLFINYFLPGSEEPKQLLIGAEKYEDWLISKGWMPGGGIPSYLLYTPNDEIMSEVNEYLKEHKFWGEGKPIGRQRAQYASDLTMSKISAMSYRNYESPFCMPEYMELLLFTDVKQFDNMAPFFSPEYRRLLKDGLTRAEIEANISNRVPYALVKMPEGIIFKADL